MKEVKREKASLEKGKRRLSRAAIDISKTVHASPTESSSCRIQNKSQRSAEHVRSGGLQCPALRSLHKGGREEGASCEGVAG